ncbi:MAG: gephyrin-like molybdotransferase Glp [Desulfatirhabdiaceae bacterium]
MDNFFHVHTIDQVFDLIQDFPRVETETLSIDQALDHVLANDSVAPENLPDFPRATMDGFAVRAASTFGATESNPALLNLTGTIGMGQKPDFSVGIGEAARIATGGMLPDGADAVVMIEYTDPVDDDTIEVYKSVAPGTYVVAVGEDFSKHDVLIPAGKRLRPQEIGLLAAFGIQTVHAYRKPRIGIISTGDEIVPIHEIPGPGKIRDINTYTLSGLVASSGAIPVSFGLVADHFETLQHACEMALNEMDMVLVSGGSSVGTRDFTIQALSAIPDSHLLVHGIAISPGKPTILAKCGNKAFWGLPGHVVSAMVVFLKIVKPWIDHISGMTQSTTGRLTIPAVLTRNVPSVHGRTDYIRVRLFEQDNTRWAEPILGKSGLINTMVRSDGLIEIGMNTEGLNQGTVVSVEIM